MVISSPIGSDGTVYVGSGDNKLYAIIRLSHRLADGGPQQCTWEFGSGSWDKKLYAINGKTTAPHHRGQQLYAINGNLKREYVVPPPPSALMARLYVGSNDKKLYAINGKTGAKLWEQEVRYEVLPRHRI